MKTEIKVSHVHLENHLLISDDYVQLLIVESPSEFYNMVADLNGQFEGNEGQFVFSHDGKIVSAEKKGAILSNLFDFDLNDRKLLSLLHKRLETIALGEKIVQFHELTAKTVLFLEELSFSSPFALDYAEPQLLDYLKAAGVRFETQYQSLEEKIVCYINAFIELKGCEFFVFVNLKSVLSDEKLKQLYAHCRREQVGLLLVEDSKRRPLLDDEKAIIITDDLCEILENYEEIC